MKRLALLLLLTATAHAATWYARPDGGSRDNPSGSVYGACDGTVDQSYVAAGGSHPFIPWQPNHTFANGAIIAVNNYDSGTGYYWQSSGGTSQDASTSATLFQGAPTTATDGTITWTRLGPFERGLHCAVMSPYYFYADGGYATAYGQPNYTWIGTGGDTYIIRGSIGSGQSYRVGSLYDYADLGYFCDANGCWGLAGNQFDGQMPAPPSGSSGAHTQLLGENYASCSAQSSRTQLHAGWKSNGVLWMQGASYVDVQCLDLTDFSACGNAGQSLACTTHDDFAKVGLVVNNTTNHVTFTNIRTHGLGNAGVQGATGDAVVFNHLEVVGNAGAGFNADDGSGTTGHGSLLVENFDISWNGFAEEYPIVDALPYAYGTDAGTGGYGDCFGTTTLDSSPAWNVTFDTGTVSYCTQDGLDALHIGGTGSTMSVNHVHAYSNQGQQIKVGGAAGSIKNSVITANCNGLISQVIPGRPVPTHDNLSQPCRAGNSAVVLATTPGVTVAYQGNTLFSYNNIGLEIAPNGTPDSTNSVLYNDNIFTGFGNPLSEPINILPTPIYSDIGSDDLSVLTNPGSSWTHNDYINWRTGWSCPMMGESSALCVDPQLTNDTMPAYGEPASVVPTGGSPVIAAGVNPPSLGTDINGVMRPNPPSIGAAEPSGPAPPSGNTTMGGGVKFSGSVIVQ